MREAFSWRFLIPLYLGSTLNPINSSLIATALVPIATSIHVAVGQTALLVSALYLASSIAQPTAGKLAEEFGPRRVLLAGIAIVFLGGIVGATGSHLTALVIARILIGIGTSAGYPSSMLMIRRRAEAAGMTKPPGGVLGGIQVAGTVLIAIGLPLGGVLVAFWGWRSAFLVNVPAGIVAFTLAAAWLPRDPALAPGKTLRSIAQRIDAIGIAGFAAAMSCLLAFLFTLPHPNWMLLAIGALAMALFVWWELRTQQPFIDVRLLSTNRALTRTYTRFALMTLCIYSVLYGLTQWLQSGRGIGPQEAGLLILPMTVISAVIVPPISRRNLIRWPLILGAAGSLAASVAMLFLTTATPIVWIVAITLIVGGTLGTASSGNQIALYTQVEERHMGTASGLFRTFGYVGSIASSAVIGVAFSGGASDRGLHASAAVMAIASVLAIALTLADRSLRNVA